MLLFFLLMLGNTASVLLVSACPGLVLALDWRAHYKLHSDKRLKNMFNLQLREQLC